MLSFKRPKNLYIFNTVETLEKIGSENLFVSLDEINKPDYVLVDVRKHHDYNRGHLENAININSAAILDDENIGIFKELQNTNKTIVLYGKNPEQAIAPHMILYQLGYTNIKVLPIENSYDHNKLITKTVEVEKYANDIKGFIAESVKKTAEAAKAAEVVEKPKVVVKPQPKKVITIEKKRKAPVEGGC